MNPHALVIGAGDTRAAITHDLALRGLRATLLDRFGPASGTTGHTQAQLHSGARFAVSDQQSARECTEVSPAAVEPATAIMNLRKERLISAITRKG